MSKSITNPRVCIKKMTKQCANLVWLKKTSPRIEHVRTSCNLCVYLVVKKKNSKQIANDLDNSNLLQIPN